jgi:hypothetical protein
MTAKLITFDTEARRSMNEGLDAIGLSTFVPSGTAWRGGSHAGRLYAFSSSDASAKTRDGPNPPIQHVRSSRRRSDVDPRTCSVCSI